MSRVNFVRGSKARVNLCTLVVANCVGKQVSKIARYQRIQENCQILKNLGKSAFQLSSTAFRFPQRLSTFLGGFPLSSTAFRFPQLLSAFLGGFPLSSMAFGFPQWISTFLGGFLLSSMAFRFLFLIKKYQIIRSHINGNSIAQRGSTYAIGY